MTHDFCAIFYIQNYLIMFLLTCTLRTCAPFIFNLFNSNNLKFHYEYECLKYLFTPETCEIINLYLSILMLRMNLNLTLIFLFVQSSLCSGHTCVNSSLGKPNQPIRYLLSIGKMTIVFKAMMVFKES